MKENKKLTVINFFSGPGSGKSTIAAGVFCKMKKNNMKVELVHEVAKDFIWDETYHMFTEQDYIFAEQHRLIRRLVRHDIDYAVVDSSLVLGLLYMPDWYPKSLSTLILEVFNTYTNINIFIQRNHKFQYVEEGRNETYEQAIEKDEQMRHMLADCGIPYKSFLNEERVEDRIVEYIEQNRLTLP